MELLWGVLISLIPLLLAVIFAKRYNFLHGLVTYIFFTYLMLFLSVQFADKITGNVIMGHALTYLNSSFELIKYICDYIAKLPFINGGVSDAGTVRYIYLGLFVGVFVICQIIASIMAASRRRKIRNLKKQAKRY